MDISEIWEQLTRDGARIVYLVLDGGGGLAHPDTGLSALQAAHTPNLDRVAQAGSCGLLELVGPGITPGSGPGHLALFGYDPLRYRIGRGLLSALGIDFPLHRGDVAARVNFATLDGKGLIVDRRAGRIGSELNAQLCARVLDALDLDFGGQVFLETVSGHRAVLVLRGPTLDDDVTDTDPQGTGVAPNPARAADVKSEPTAQLLNAIVDQARAALSDRDVANGMLLRGVQRYDPLPTLGERFGLSGLCLANYPMYRGLSRLLGMDLLDPPDDFAAAVAALGEHYDDGHGLYFLHVKATDEAGEDADFDAKVAALEAVDREIEALLDMQPDVLVVTADHSTPALLGAHSWHPVPVVVHSPMARRDAVERFDELACAGGVLGLRPGLHLMGLALANAGRLRKFGA